MHTESSWRLPQDINYQILQVMPWYICSTNFQIWIIRYCLCQYRLERNFWIAQIFVTTRSKRFSSPHFRISSTLCIINQWFKQSNLYWYLMMLTRTLQYAMRRNWKWEMAQSIEYLKNNIIAIGGSEKNPSFLLDIDYFRLSFILMQQL